MNHLEIDEYNRIIAALKGADEVDIHIRKDGQDHHFEADWLLMILERNEP